MPPLAPPLTTPTPWSPWEARAGWQDAALLVALVLAPEALQLVRDHLDDDGGRVRPVDDPQPRSRRFGRRPGVRPPRSC